MLPAVTIGIPTYQRPILLKRALASAVAQDYPNLAIIVSDNASGDDTGAVVASFDDPRVSYHRQVASVGAIGNFQWLLDHSTSPLFMWLADDDAIGEGFVTSCVLALTDHPDWVAACGETSFRWPGGEVEYVEAPSLLADDRYRRVWAHYGEATCNSAMYSLIRRCALTGVPLHTSFGSDVFYTAALAYRGKVGTAAGATAQRSFGGASADIPGLAAAHGLSSFWQRRPYSRMAVDVFRYVLSGEPPYNGGLARRAATATFSAWAIEYRFHLYPQLAARTYRIRHRRRYRAAADAGRASASLVRAVNRPPGGTAPDPLT
jgi:glycosyltransferase involved in cell wall biosynthesis